MKSPGLPNLPYDNLRRAMQPLRLAYATVGHISFTYHITLPDIQDLLEPLERAVTDVVIPAVTDHTLSEGERELLSLYYNLNKREFRDAVKLQYDWEIADMPTVCTCGDQFTVDHAMICRRGGFIIQRHNELRDLEAELLSTVCNDVEVEPVLQKVTGEILNDGANKAPDARLDIHARGFWEKHHRYSSTFACAIQMLILIKICNQIRYTGNTKTRRNGNMQAEFRKLSMEHSPPPPCLYDNRWYGS